MQVIKYQYNEKEKSDMLMYVCQWVNLNEIIKPFEIKTLAHNIISIWIKNLKWHGSNTNAKERKKQVIILNDEGAVWYNINLCT